MKSAFFYIFTVIYIFLGCSPAERVYMRSDRGIQGSQATDQMLKSGAIQLTIETEANTNLSIQAILLEKENGEVEEIKVESNSKFIVDPLLKFIGIVSSNGTKYLVSPKMPFRDSIYGVATSDSETPDFLKFSIVTIIGEYPEFKIQAAKADSSEILKFRYGTLTDDQRYKMGRQVLPFFIKNLDYQLDSEAIFSDVKIFVKNVTVQMTTLPFFGREANKLKSTGTKLIVCAGLDMNDPDSWQCHTMDSSEQELSFAIDLVLNETTKFFISLGINEAGQMSQEYDQIFYLRKAVADENDQSN